MLQNAQIQKYRNVHFSAVNKNYDSFFVNIPLINDHLSYEYFVRCFVGQDIKGINVQN